MLNFLFKLAEPISAFASLGTFVVAMVGLIAAYRRFYQQRRLTFYEQYTNRCAKIMEALPLAVLCNEKLNESEELVVIKYLFIYFDLCSEEYYLYQNKYVEQDVWKEWKEGMTYFFNQQNIRIPIKIVIDKNRDAYPEFIAFLEDEILANNK